MKTEWLEESGGYGNGHEEFHIAQDGLKAEDVASAILQILVEAGGAADGYLDSTGARFSTAKEDIDEIAKKLSLMFPDAVVFGQDCWDCEGYVVCYENGMKSTNYRAKIEVCEESQDDEAYYDITAVVTAPNGYEFEIGGGLVYKDEIESIKEFVRCATGDFSLPDIDR